MANKAISELPQALNVNNQDLFVLEQSGIAKKLTAETFITEQGIIDALAEALDGHGGIQSVTLSSVSGRVRTYLITFTDGSATTFQVYDGTSIDRIVKTSTAGLVDTYTVFMNDGTTTFFTVTNGADGTVSEAMLNDALKDKAPAITETTESSAIANFTDGADNMAMYNVVAEINPVQSGSGDPAPDNIRPISGWTGCNVTRTGKNLADFADLSVPTSTDNSATLGSVSLKAGTYTLSYSLDTTVTATRNRPWFMLNGSNTYGPDIKTAGRGSWTFTLSSDSTLTFYWWYHTVSLACTVSDFQLEVGTTATTYEPYITASTVSLSWQNEAGTVYGGTIDVATGLLTVDRAKYTLSGQSGGWNASSSYPGSYYINLRYLLDYEPNTPFLCTHAKSVSSSSEYVYGACFCDNSLNFRIMSSDSTLQDWKDYIEAQRQNGTPIEICFRLATPQTYQLTPQEVKTLLGTNNVWANTGNVSVTYPTDTKMNIELTQLLQDNNLAYVESSSSASRAYAVNDLFVNRDGLLCKVTATVSSGGTLVEGTNYTILSGNGGLGAEVTSVLNGKEDAGWLTGMGFSRTDVSGGGNVTIKDYTIFLAKLITVSGANIQSLVNAHYKVTFYLRNSNGGSFSLSGNCAGNTYNLSADSSGLVSGTYEGDVSANGTIYNGLVGGSVGSGSIFAATVLVKF